MIDLIREKKDGCKSYDEIISAPLVIHKKGFKDWLVEVSNENCECWINARFDQRNKRWVLYFTMKYMLKKNVAGKINGRSEKYI